MIDIAQLPSALRLLADRGTTNEYRTVALYDLGAHGVTVAVADVESGEVLASADTVGFSGQVLDRVVLDHLVLEGIIARPTDPSAETEILDFCRRVKESLSTASSASTPGGGTTLITRARFDDLLDFPLRRSVGMIEDLVERTDRSVDAVVLTGGGARVPAVSRVLAEMLRVGVVIPERPESFGDDLVVTTRIALDPAVVEQTHLDENDDVDGDLDSVEQAYAYSDVQPVRYTAEVDDDMDFEPPEERVIEPRRSRVPAVVVVLIAALVLAGATVWAYQGATGEPTPAVGSERAPDASNTEVPTATGVVPGDGDPFAVANADPFADTDVDPTVDEILQGSSRRTPVVPRLGVGGF